MHVCKIMSKKVADIANVKIKSTDMNVIRMLNLEMWGYSHFLVIDRSKFSFEIELLPFNPPGFLLIMHSRA